MHGAPLGRSTTNADYSWLSSVHAVTSRLRCVGLNSAYRPSPHDFSLNWCGSRVAVTQVESAWCQFAGKTGH
jgi:hypothetical protein